MKPYISMKNISKSFSGVQVLHNVNLDIELGKVHALVGENGAGKSTLMKILCGTFQPDSGGILIDGKKVKIKSPLEGIKNGISMIYQELNYVPEMTITENIFLGREETKYGLIDYKKMREKTKELLDNLEIKFSPVQYLREFKISETQLIEICKAISYDTNVIVMDEPTSSLSNKETERLFKVIREIKKRGKAIIYISHKLDEITEISDEVTVLRDGYIVASKINTNETEMKEIISLMVGRKLQHIFPKRDFNPGKVVLEVRNLNQKGKVKNVTFQLREREILGVSGLMGSGRTEMAEALFGLGQHVEGEILLKGKKIKIEAPSDAIKHKIGFVTEDRKSQGLFLLSSIKDNIIIVSLKKILTKGFISKRKEIKIVDEKIAALRVKTNSRDQLVKYLSGGNQQKVAIAKWLVEDLNIFIFDEPTRGIDVGAKVEIYNLINQMALEGYSIIFISSELPEIMGLSDRVLVFYDNQIAGELDREEMTQEKIMMLSTGNKLNE